MGEKYLKYLIDSNIWIYYFDNTLPEHQSVCSYVDTLIDTENIVVTSIIVIEVCHYLYRRLGSEIGYQKSDLFILGGFEIIDFYHADLVTFREIFKQNLHLGLGGRDISILVSMIKEKIEMLVTHDQSFKYVSFIKMIDPIKI